MKTFLHHIWERLRTSYWFVPGMMVLLLSLSAFASLWVDETYGEKLVEMVPSLWQVSPEGIRALLSTVATSLLTLVGVTFSGTLVALTMASGQFGSRLLRNFIRKPVNQVTLGFLLGNFFMCLFVMRSVRDAGDASNLPHIGAFMVLLATVVSLGLFIYFIHRLATSLQADEIVHDVHTELHGMIDSFFPEKEGCDEDDDQADSERGDWERKREGEIEIRAGRAGYLQVVNVERLFDLACGNSCPVRVVVRPGQFINAGDCVAYREAVNVDSEVLKKVSKCFIIGGIRNADQDIEFCLGQLVEVALRALSPGINDPFTAVTCVDYIGASMCKIAERALPKREFKNDDGDVCVRTRPTSFEAIMETAFLQLRQTSADRPDLSIRLIQTLESVGKRACGERRRELVLRHARHVVEGARDQFNEPDRCALDEAFKKLQKSLTDKE